MCPKVTKSSASIIGYSLPRFHNDPKAPYVDFTAFDPLSGSLKRKKYHIKARLSQKKRRERAAEIIAAITSQLRAGWSPWAENAVEAGIITIDTAIQRYEANIDKNCRRKTKLSYGSRVNILREYIKSLPHPPKYTYQIDRAFIIGFLDYVYLDRDNNARTRNNYLGWINSFCSFMVDRNMIDTNPAENIKKISESEKKRQPLTEDMIRSLVDFLSKEDPHYLLACMMQYYTLIRPSELCRLKIGDISVKKRSVFVSASISKNKRDGAVGIPDALLRLMLDLKVLDMPTDRYLFGSDFRPGCRNVSPDAFNKRWHKVRAALGWDDCYQFYSLKDSGIRDLANAAGVVTARDQARHTDISTTNKYLKGKVVDIPVSILSFRGSVGDSLESLNQSPDKTHL